MPRHNEQKEANESEVISDREIWSATAPAGLWSFGGSLVQPIFTGGRIRSNVRSTEARQQEALLTYRQTIQQAFRGVSDSLVEYRKDREFREYRQQLVLSAQDAAQLSEMRYRGRGRQLPGGANE
jgi:outer membrane protein, multidrug efflux system